MCTGRKGWVVDHGKSPVFNVRVHMKDAVIVCVCVGGGGGGEGMGDKEKCAQVTI